jgi:hypothetical protein
VVHVTPRSHYTPGKRGGRGQFKCDDTRAETIFRLSTKRTSPFKSAGASVQLTTSSRDVRISSNNAGYIIFRGSVKSTGYPLHSPVSRSLPLPSVTVCHHISTGVYSSYRRLGGLCRRENPVASTGVRTQPLTVQPITSIYTDCALPAPVVTKFHTHCCCNTPFHISL